MKTRIYRINCMGYSKAEMATHGGMFRDIMLDYRLLLWIYHSSLFMRANEKVSQLSSRKTQLAWKFKRRAIRMNGIETLGAPEIAT